MPTTTPGPSQESPLLIDDAEGVRTLTLNRPDRLNALTIPLRLAIQAAVEEFDEDDDLRVLLLTGAGRGFCAGSDLGGGQEPAEPQRLRDHARLRFGWHLPLDRTNKPTIAAVNGVAAGGEFLVNQTTAGDQRRPAIDFDGNGSRFMVTWTSDGQDGSGLGIYARRFDANGTPTGGEFRVNDSTVGDQTPPDVAGNDLGSFMFVWQSDGQDGSGWGVYRRYYSTLGFFLNTDRLVNTHTAGDQYDPAVAYNGDRDFLIAWASDGEDGSGGLTTY